MILTHGRCGLFRAAVVGGGFRIGFFVVEIRIRLGFEDFAVEGEFAVFQPQAGGDVVVVEFQVAIGGHGVDGAAHHGAQGFVDVFDAGGAFGFVFGVDGEQAAGAADGDAFEQGLGQAEFEVGLRFLRMEPMSSKSLRVRPLKVIWPSAWTLPAAVRSRRRAV